MIPALSKTKVFRVGKRVQIDNSTHFSVIKASNYEISLNDNYLWREPYASLVVISTMYNCGTLMAGELNAGPFPQEFMVDKVYPLLFSELRDYAITLNKGLIIFQFAGSPRTEIRAASMMSFITNNGGYQESEWINPNTNNTIINVLLPITKNYKRISNV